MVAPTYPGVYFDHVAGPPGPIQGVSTSNLAMIGYTPKGPIDDPTRRLNYTEFVAKFGTTTDSLMNRAALAFFNNGGQRLYVVRTLASDAEYGVVYLSEVVSDEDTGEVGDTIEVTFTFFTANSPLEPGTVTVKDTSVVETFADDGAGTLTGDQGGSGTVDYNTGEITVTFNAAPAAEPILCGYSYVLFQFDMKWPGDANNDFRITLDGSPLYEDAATASFTRFDLTIWEKDSDGVYQEVKTFTELVLDDANDADFIATVINDVGAGSDDITVTATGNNQNPTTMEGTATAAEVVVEVPAYDGAVKAHAYTLAAASCYPTTFELTLSTGEIVVDDGVGGLSVSGGANTLNPYGTNEIDYDTGVATITWATATAGGTTNAIDSYSQPAADTITEDFAGGADGSAVGRAAVSAAALQATKQGMYALDKDDNLFLICIPDFETEILVQGDMVDYCESRKDRFALLTVPEGYDYLDADNYMRRTFNRNSSYYAMYYPHVVMQDPLTNRAMNFPVGAYAAGCMARTDEEKNVSKAPAGTEDGELRFSIGLETC